MYKHKKEVVDLRPIKPLPTFRTLVRTFIVIYSNRMSTC
jgi:hypothetical protein